MPEKKYHIGTSGWSYPHWKEIFYPIDLPATQWLTFYAKTFDITEINTSFYHLPKHQTVLNWAAKVPKGFKFCPKISRYLTHMKKLKDPEESLENFFEVFESIVRVLGPVLVQLPPSLKFNYDRTEYFYKLLKKQYRKYEFVMEVRHNTWLHDDSLNLMSKYNIGLVISQSGNVFPYSEMVTAKNVYVRFHGPGYLYASEYSEEMLNDFATKFKKWIKRGHVIWAFFNNDVHGYAFRDAQRLMNMMK
ncbi:MAG: DUF72 domain-containing protein [Chitinophagaceae bacterium]|nr:DUF72 domain-containing protein [Chitinophagaceae bacterium]